MHLQGPVPLDDHDYAQRPFELELVKAVQAGDWVLLLGPRQHGKTSAFLRLRQSLKDHGTQAVMVDLQKIPPIANYPQLVAWFARQVATALGNENTIGETNALDEALEQAIPPGVAPVVILIDEASNIKDDTYRNSFFGQLRAIHGERGAAADEHIAKRLRFVFAGTFRPERLVAEQNSPFNTCRRLDTTDLEQEAVAHLVERAGVADAEIVAARIYEEVGGQPFLIQSVIHSVIGSAAPLEVISDELEVLSYSDHVSNLFRRVVNDESLSEIVSAVASNGQIATAAGDEDQRFLIVLGVLQRHGGLLRFRNRLYAQTAARSPQFTRVAIPAVAHRAVLFPLDLAAFVKVADPRMREIAFKAQKGAIGAYQHDACRIALAGFGAAIEAVLIDYLSRQAIPDLAAAAGHRVNAQRREVATDPTTWSLFNLINGSRGLLGQNALDVPQNLREWRNLIHPGVCLVDYRPDDDLVHEVGVAANQLGIILRDLP